MVPPVCPPVPGRRRRGGRLAHRRDIAQARRLGPGRDPGRRATAAAAADIPVARVEATGTPAIAGRARSMISSGAADSYDTRIVAPPALADIFDHHVDFDPA